MKTLLLTSTKRLLLLLCLMAGSTLALAQTTYYVSPTGSNSNTATQAQNRTSPWATINKAVTEASAGDIIYVMPGAYTSEPANTITVNKRLTIIGEDSGVSYLAGSLNRINAQFIITATGGSATNRVILKNLPIANVNVSYTIINDATTAAVNPSIVVKASFVTIENCKIRHSGQTTLGLGAANGLLGFGIIISRISASERDYEDILITGNHFAAMQTAVWVEDDVNLNMSSSSQLKITNNYVDRLTGYAFMFDERSATIIGKSKNILIENNQIIMNTLTGGSAPLGQPHAMMVFKGENFDFKHNTLRDIQTGQNNRMIQLTYRWQGDLTGFNFNNTKIDRSNTVGGFINSIYIKPEYHQTSTRAAGPGCGITANINFAANPSKLSNIVVDGLYSLRYHAGVFAQFNVGNIEVKNSYIPRNRHRVAAGAGSISLFTSDQYQATAPTCTGAAQTYNSNVGIYTTASHTINNNFLDSNAANTAIEYIFSYSTISPTLTGIDNLFGSRNISSWASSSLTGKLVANLAPAPATARSITGVSGNNLTMSGNPNVTGSGLVTLVDNTSALTANVKIYTRAYDDISITNTQSNPFVRTNSAGVAQTASGSFSAAITAASTGDNIYAYFGSMGTSQGPFTIDKTINLVNVGCDRFDSSTAVRYLNLTIATGVTVTLKGDMYTRGDLTINGTLDLNGFALICNGGITYGASGVIKGGPGSQIIFNTPNTRSNVDLKMDNSTAAASTLDYLIVNMAVAGSPTITMQSNVIIGKQLNILRGRLAVGANRLTIKDMPIINPSNLNLTTSSELYYEGSYPHNLPNLSAGISRLGLLGANKYWATSTIKTNNGFEMGANATLENGGIALEFNGAITSTASSKINTSGVTILTVNATSDATLPQLGNAVGDLNLDAGANTITFRNNPVIAFDFLSTGKIQFANGNVHFQGDVLAEEFVGNNNIRLYFENTTAGTQAIGTVFPAVKSIYINRGGSFNLNITSGDVYVTDSLIRVSGTGTITGTNGDVFTTAYITPALNFTGDANSSVYYRATGSGLVSDRVFNSFSGDSLVYEMSPTVEMNANGTGGLSLARYINVKSGKTIFNEDVSASVASFIRGGATALFNAGSVLDGAGTFTAENGATIELLGTDGLAATGATGAVQVTGTRTLNSGTFVRYLATGTLSTGTMIPDNIRKLEVNNAGAGLNLSKSLNIDTLLTTAGRLNLNGFKLTLDGAGPLGTISLNGGVANSRLEIAGSGSGTFATLNFGGSPSIDSLRMNRASGNIIIGNNLTLNSGLSLVAGRIITTNANCLIIADNATSTGGSATAFVDGPLRKIGNDAFTFPIGETDKYAPLGISAPVNATAEFRATFFKTGNTNTTLPFMNPGLVSVTQNERYDLTRLSSDPIDSVNVTLHWFNGASIGIADLPDLRVAHYNSSITKWENYGNSGTTGTVTAGTVTSAKKLHDFSPVAIGSSTNDNPLPVVLGSFKGIIINGNALLSWITFAELNNKGFNIQRSYDGKNFETIGFVKGKGNSNRINSYQFEDVNFIRNAYYRLEQEDFDGKKELSPVIQLNRYATNEGLKVTALENPFSAALQLQIESVEAGAGTLIILDMMGRKVHSQDLNLNAGFTFVERLLKDVPAGVYIVQVSSAKGSASTKVIKNR